jgi:mannonate dehydratase
MGHREPAGEVFQIGYTFRDGYMHPGDQPGLGVTFDENAAARYPKYLPVNRRRDGTVHDW